MCAVRPVGWGRASSRAAHTVSRDRMSRLRSLSGSLHAPVRRCEGAGGMWAHSRRESAREARLGIVSAAKVGCARGRGCVAEVRRAVGGCATPLLSVAGVAHASWNKGAATGVTRVGRVVFARGELTCCSRARMLGVKCR